MPSIDTLITAIRASLDQVCHLIAGLGESQNQATELRDGLGGLGVEGSAAQFGVVVDSIEEGQAQAAALADRLEAALATVEAARTGAGGGSGGSAVGSSGGGGGAPPGPAPTAPGPRGAPGYPHHQPHPISWSDLIHVCHGDENNIRRGGHLAGTGRPGKTEFPQTWDDVDVREALTAVASSPATTQPKGGGKFSAIGFHRGVEIDVIVRSDGSIEAGWPLSGPGVRTNPK